MKPPPKARRPPVRDTAPPLPSSLFQNKDEAITMPLKRDYDPRFVPDHSTSDSTFSKFSLKPQHQDVPEARHSLDALRGRDTAEPARGVA